MAGPASRFARAVRLQAELAAAGRRFLTSEYIVFVVMSELRVRDAFTTDHHFRQAGFIPLLKSGAPGGAAQR